MNPVQKAIADVKWAIPEALLTEAFIRREFGRQAIPATLDTMIRQKVIEARVKPDCDLGGGHLIRVPLDELQPEFIDPITIVYRVPKALLQGRSIQRVLSIVYGSMYTTYSASSYGSNSSPILDAAGALIDSLQGIPAINSAYIRLIAENTILITQQPSLPSQLTLLCYVGYDTDMNLIRSTTQEHFTQLVEYAVKAYVYNKLVIEVGQGELSGGLELGQFKQILDGYADAYENYKTYIKEVWRKVMIMDDSTARERHLAMITGGRH